MENYVKALEKLLNTLFKRNVNSIFSKYSTDYVSKVKVTDRKSEFLLDFQHLNFIVRIYTTDELPDDIIYPILSYCVVTTSLIIQGNFTLDILFIDPNDQIYYNTLSGKRFVDNTSDDILLSLENRIKDYYDIDKNG